jgi:hypothetical protein
MSEQNKEQKINIELPEEIADGVYCNLAIITHSHSEFILDFINVMPGVPKAKVKQRIILTPQHAKRLMNALKDNIGKFEQNFGDIKGSDQGQMMPPYNITGPIGEA